MLLFNYISRSLFCGQIFIILN